MKHSDKNKRNSLAENTAMLYVLTICNYVFGFITVPYLTRVLGPSTYGAVGFAQGISVYLQLVLDFGFILSATSDIAKARDDEARISHIMSAALEAKIALCIICFALILPLCLFVPQFGDSWQLIMLYFVYVVINCFIPDFVYRGIEQMRSITYRTVAVKGFFVICVFLFVKSPTDYLLVPTFYALGSLIAVVVVYKHLANTFSIVPTFVGLGEVVGSLKRSFQYFVSRIASTFYSSLNTIVIGLVWPGSNVLGCYSATDKVISAGRSVSSPIADSMYPYMLRTKDFDKLIKISLLGFGVLVAGIIPCEIFAMPICTVLFGEEYASASIYLQTLLPLIPISMLSYLYGFPALAPLGLSGVANSSVVVGALVQVLLLMGLAAFGALTVEGVCCCTLATEIAVLLIRLIAFTRGYTRYRANREKEDMHDGSK